MRPPQKQPVVLPKINTGHPLAKRLTEFYLLGSPSPVDVARRQLVAPTYTGTTSSVGPHGVQVQVANSAANKLQMATPAVKPVAYTLAFLCRMTTDAWVAFAGLVSLATSANSNVLGVSELNGKIVVYHDDSNNATSGIAAATYFPVDGNTWVLFSCDWDGSLVRFYKNGLFQASAAMSSNISPTGTADHWNIGNERAATVARPGGYVFLARWDRAFVAAEHAAFASNPWQIFRPSQRRIYVNAAGPAVRPRPLSVKLQPINRGMM